jgi:PAS domain S-box-containing protein
MTAEPADELTRRRATRDADEEAVDRADRAEAMYQSLVESLPGVTYSESLDHGKTLSVSPQIEDLLGYTPEEWTANPRTQADAVHPDDRERVETSCAEANASGEPWRVEYRMITRDGRVIWVRDIATLVRGSKGQPLCWQGICFEISGPTDGDA